MSKENVREAIVFLIKEYEGADKKDKRHIDNIKTDIKAIIQYNTEDIPEDLTMRMWEILNNK